MPGFTSDSVVVFRMSRYAQERVRVQIVSFDRQDCSFTIFSTPKVTRSKLVTGADNVAQDFDVWESGVPKRCHDSVADGVHYLFSLTIRGAAIPRLCVRAVVRRRELKWGCGVTVLAGQGWPAMMNRVQVCCVVCCLCA